MPSLAAEWLKDALFPKKCLLCGRFLGPGVRPFLLDIHEMRRLSGTEAFYRAMTPHVCPACLALFQPTIVGCDRCGQGAGDAGKPTAMPSLCRACLESPPAYSRARSLGMYEGPLMAAIHRLKYHHATRLSGPLGRLLFKVFITHWPLGDIDVVAPIPLHPSRLRQRGFNQALLLVREWPKLYQTLGLADGAGLASSTPSPTPQLVIDARLLARKRKTLSQTGLGRNERALNVKNAFCVPRPGTVKGRRILLVDDVYTTGATANECARVLMEYQAARVDVITLARTD